MAVKTKDAYLYTWLVSSMKTADPDEAAKELPRLFSVIHGTYLSAKNSGDYSKLSRTTIENAGKEDQKEKLLTIDEMRYDGRILFASIGISNKTLESMVRQRDTRTMKADEIVLASPQKSFEFFTFFAIDVQSRRLAILRNKDMPNYLHRLIAILLTTAIGGEPYTFEAELYSEKSLRERINEMKHIKLEASFALHDLDMSGKPSMNRIMQRSTNKGSCRIYYSGRFTYKLSPEEVDEIIGISEDEDCKKLKIHDLSEGNTSTDALDLLKEIVQEKRKITITATEAKKPDIVYDRLSKILLN